MALAPGTKLGLYEIQSPLGAGGMGEVYRAADTKLGRDIALKVLPAEMAQDAERLGRFRREARALAQLDHPNIVTIYSVEECDGVHFLTMQLVEGLPLDRLIPQGGLPVDQIVEIAGALGDALAAAHEKGIVHRDLKPANVMVSSEGRVKVLDFGLAKDVRTANFDDATMTSASRTEVGVVMGTPAYMSPEQTSGRPLDHRSDIFSLGVVLHEMSTGRRPFDGSSSAELISAILRDTPPSVTDARPDLPSDLARVIRRCLEKEPRHRVQTARDVSNEFRDLSRQTAKSVSPIQPAPASVVPVPDSTATRAAEGFWVAVLPFQTAGASVELKALADGMSEELITCLSRFSYLHVIARGSTLRYANQGNDLREVGKALGARYVMEGNIRQAGTRLRIAVQLVDASSGAHLWAETYERTFSPESIFELQDDMVPRIVSTVADTSGVLPRSMSEAVRNKPPQQLSPYEAVLLSFGYNDRISAEEHAATRAALERAVQQAPAYAHAWAMLSLVWGDEHAQGFGGQPDPLGRALQAARKAVDLDPSNHRSFQALASAHFHRKEIQAFRIAAERAIALNPMDGCTIANMGGLMASAGDWEHGCTVVEQAMQLNPNHPGWYWFPLFHNAYRKRDYRRALGIALKVNLPGYYFTHVALAISYAQLDDQQAASQALQELLALVPNFAAIARPSVSVWLPPEIVEHVMDGLRKAGLEIASQRLVPSNTAPARTVAAADSAGARAEEGFWVAVLPFKYSGGNADLTALTEGLTEEIVTGLSRFSYLRVISRGSTAKYSSESGDVRAIGKELGARYVMEGSLRQAGTKLRLAVQLVDATTGAHLWAETYERGFNSDAAFELQDDLVPRIVSTVADMHGVLPRSMSAVVRSKASDQLTPYEALLRGFGHSVSFSPSDIVDVQSSLERALQQSSNNADCLAMLAIVQGDAYGWSDQFAANTLDGALRAAQAAAEAEPTNALAYHALAKVLFFKRNIPAFRAAADRAVSLNPMDGATIAYMGILMAFAGDWERGVRLTEKGMQLNANHPGWHLMTAWHDAYRRKDYPKALELALKLNAPKNPWVQRSLTVSYAQLGRNAEASSSLRDLLALVPNYAQVAREMHSRWLEPELVEHMMDGLRKAGLEIDGKAPRTSSVTVPAQTTSRESRAEEGFWVAVLPFKYSGGNADLSALTEGLTEEIVTGLSRFSYLRVIARGSTAKYSSESVDVRSAGKELGARYVMEGSLRQAGTKLRLAVQLVDATSGAHLWAENFERTFSPETVFELQDDLVPRIVSTVADHYGVLAHSMSESLRGKGSDQLSPYEAVLRSFGYYERLAPDEHALVRFGLERAVQQLPNYADAWAMLSIIYGEEYKYGFNARPDPLGRALEAGRRATDAESSNHFAYLALAQTLFLRKEFPAFRAAAERALTLNPMDSGTIALMGVLMSFAGDWERGRALVERAMQLNPKHPGWYWFAPFYDAYRKRDYRGALDVGLKINMLGLYSTHVATAAAYGQLGERDAAGKALRELLVLWPDFAEFAREDLGKWVDPELIEHVLDGLRKAGLQVSPEKAAGAPALVSSNPSAPISGAMRAEEGFWVAVLPFKYSGANAGLSALSEGLTEEIVTGLSRFSYLKVISRSSTSRYANASVDIRSAGKELGARYVMEGSLRQAGTKLRLAVQLVDATSGAHLWAENFERTFSPETVFELQDDLVPRIVSTVADMYGVLARSMSEAIRGKADEELNPHEAVLRAFGYMERVTPQEHARVRRILERAVSIAPNQSDAWAMLANLYWEEHAHGLNPQPDPLGRALAAARRAVDAAPTNNLAHYALACTLFFRKDFMAFRAAAEQAIELNRMDASVAALIGNLIAYAGDWERGCAVVASAMQLNPHHPGWYWFVHFNDAYRRGDYRGALDSALKINLPGNFYTHAVIASAYGQLGMHDEARKALQELFALRPDFAKTVREEYGRWFHDLAFIEHQLDGLRKAGLEIAGEPGTASLASEAN